MNKKLWQFLALSVAVLLAGTATFTGCASAPPQTALQAQWFTRMHRLSSALSALTPMAIDEKKFTDFRNNAAIKYQLAELTEASAELSKDYQGPKDPLVNHTAKLFAQDMAYANEQFNSGEMRFSRAIVANGATYCISCHTRTDRGTKDFPLMWTLNVKNLNDMQQTQYFLANRQYNAAFKSAQRVAANTAVAKADPEAWREVIEKTLAMLVRVEKDVSKTVELVKQMSSNSAIPANMREDAVAWLKDADEWRASMNRKTVLNSDRQKYKAAVKIYELSKARQSFPSHSGLILNLRASELLHEILDNPKSSHYADALYYAGLTSELMGGLAVWSINDTYFESCIRARPHSPLSRHCYSRLEASIQSRYTVDTANADVLKYQKSRLNNLDTLTEPLQENQRWLDRRQSDKELWKESPVRN